MATTWSLLLGYYVGLGLGLAFGRYVWPKKSYDRYDLTGSSADEDL